MRSISLSTIIPIILLGRPALSATLFTDIFTMSHPISLADLPLQGTLTPPSDPPQPPPTPTTALMTVTTLSCLMTNTLGTCSDPVTLTTIAPTTIIAPTSSLPSAVVTTVTASSTNWGHFTLTNGTSLAISAGATGAAGTVGTVGTTDLIVTTTNTPDEEDKEEETTPPVLNRDEDSDSGGIVAKPRAWMATVMGMSVLLL